MLTMLQYQDHAQRTFTVEKLHDIRRLTGWESAASIARGCQTSWIKSAEMGRGAPWTRISRADNGNDGSGNIGNQRMIDKALLEQGSSSEKFVIQPKDRAQFALGVLGIEEDLDNLDLKNENERTA